MNELAQWLAIAAIGLFAVSGSLRHRAPGHDRFHWESEGPPAGHKFDLAELPFLEARPSGPKILLWVAEGCDVCTDVMASLPQPLRGDFELVPIVHGSAAYSLEVERLLGAPGVRIDLREASTFRPPGFPFAVRLDTDLEVLERAIGSGVTDLLRPQGKGGDISKLTST